jgi:hypothetical protein
MRDSLFMGHRIKYVLLLWKPVVSVPTQRVMKGAKVMKKFDNIYEA